MKILVVEDKKVVQEKLQAVLTSQGHSVDIAINGLDALAKVQKADYQLYIIDHLMPLMNGIQLTKNLKNNPVYTDIPVIFMTTQGTHTLKTFPEFEFFHAVIDKPIDEQHFIEMLAEFSPASSEYQTLQLNA